LGLIGAYVSDGMVEDVVIALVFGIFAYAMKLFGFSRVPLVIALVLGKLAQKTFHQTLMRWGVIGFFNRPISLGLFIIIILMVTAPYWWGRWQRRLGSRAQ
jgi:putative tricarboxylic transport membrane protein